MFELAERRPPRAEDLYRFRFVSDVQVSPDGSRIAFVVTRAILAGKNGDYESNIWQLSGKGFRKLTQLTNRPGRNTNPRWSPHGHFLLFLSTISRRDRKVTKLMELPVEGGEAMTFLRLEKGKLNGKIVNPQWSPDRRRIFFLSDMKDESKDKSDVKVITRISYRLNAEGYFHDRRTHVYSISTHGGKLQQITNGDYDVENFGLSRDGKRLAFIANMTPEAEYTRIQDIHVMPAAGGRSRKVTRSKGPIQAVSWSPDGRTLAYYGHNMRKRLATNLGVWTVPVSGGSAKEASAKLDRGVGNSLNCDSRVVTPDAGPVWARDGRSIYFLATDQGSCHVFRARLRDGLIENVTSGEKDVESFSFSKDGTRFAYTAIDSTSLADVWIMEYGANRRVTKFNDATLASLKIRSPEPFAFRASDGERIEGWVLHPLRRNGRKPPPAILEIHGGPRTVYGNAFMLEFQLLASAGFSVICTNPRGSSAYGEGFAYEIIHDYGNRDYRDLMGAVNYAVRKGWADPKRLGVTGGSYGGFMTNWIVTHTNRFRAAITHRSISNWQSFFGTSDIGYYFGEEEIGRKPWNNFKQYMAKSPIQYVTKVRTPLLIMHSEEDYRCPIEQGEQLFTALKMLRRETVLVRFPGENHDLSRSGKPRHRIENLDRIVNWFKSHL